MKNSKGFTLVELLVTITVMGILLVIAIPAVGNIVASNKDKKVEAYRIALERAAKLYIDENEREEFSHYDGCRTITYDTLKQANLIKEISDKDIECQYSNTYVVVNKEKKTYKYQASLDCKDTRNGGKEYKDGIATCDTVKPDIEGPSVTVTPDNQTDEWTTIKKAKKIKITLEDTGKVGFHFDKKVEYQWVKGDGSPTGSWQTLNMRNNEQATKVTTTLDKSRYPKIKGDEGLYFLHINPDSIVDIEGNKMDSSARTKFGPYQFDEKPPECKIEPSGTLKLGWYTSDVNYKLNREQLSGGPVVDYGSSDTDNKVYNKSNPNKLKDDGKDVKRYGFVKDEAGNEGSCNVSVNRDTKPPTVPIITLYKKNGDGHLGCSANSERGLGTIDSDKFYNGYIYARAKNSKDAGIGLDTYKLTTSGQDNDVTDAQQDCRNVHKQGTRVTIKFKACDKLGHCSNEKIAYTKLDRVKPTIYITTSASKGGFNNKNNNTNAVRNVYCSDDYSGVKAGTFSVDLYAGDSKYIAWDGCNGHASSCKHQCHKGRTCTSVSNKHIRHNYLITGYKDTLYQCYDEAGNNATDGEHSTCSRPHVSNSSTSSFVKVKCFCRWNNSPWDIGISAGHVCNDDADDPNEKGCLCNKAHSGINSGEDMYLSCNRR